mgnify:CR=1 FL=1
MRFGFQLPTAIEGLYMKPGSVKISDFIKIATTAEKLGFHSLWVNDHITPWKRSSPNNKAEFPNWYEVLMTLSYCAAVTTEIKLGVSVLVMPFRDPVIIAKQAATIDVFSGGRFILGIGLGGPRQEFDKLYPQLAESKRGDLLDEGIEAVELLLNNSNVSFNGNYYSFDNVSLNPRSLQNPLPIYIAGNSITAFKRVAKFATGLITTSAPFSNLREKIKKLHETVEYADRNPSKIDVMLSAVLCIDHTTEKAAQRLDSSMLGLRFSEEYKKSPGHFLIGSPNEVAEKIHQLAEIGVTQIVPQHTAGDTPAQFMDQMYFLGEEVAPLFKLP